MAADTRINRLGRLTTQEAAVVLEVHPCTLERMRARGIGPPYIRVSPRRIVYERRDLERWIAKQRVVPEALPQ